MANVPTWIGIAAGILTASIPTIAQAADFSTPQTIDFQSGSCPSLMQSHQYRAAIEGCNFVIQAGVTVGQQNTQSADPATFWRNRAIALMGQQQWDAAIAAYEQAIALNPANAATWTEQGILLEQQHQPERALAAFDAAIRINPKSSLALAHRCSALNQLSKHQDAIQSCEAALTGDGDWGSETPAVAWNQRGRALIELRQYAAALASIDRAIDLNPNAVDAWNQKAVSLWHLNQLEAAVAASDRAITLQGNQSGSTIHSNTAQIWFNHGRILSSLGRYPEAIAAYDNALQNTNRTIGDRVLSDIWVNKGVAFWYLRQHQDALDALGRAIELNPNSFTAWYNQGIVLAELKQLKQALASYEQALKLQPDNASVLTAKGIALAGLGPPHDQEALAALDSALNLNPTSTLAQKKRDELLERFKPQVKNSSRKQ